MCVCSRSHVSAGFNMSTRINLFLKENQGWKWNSEDTARLTHTKVPNKLQATIWTDGGGFTDAYNVQYIPRNMHTVTALLCFVVVIHWLIFPYPSGLLYWQCGNLTIAPVPAKQTWWIWINTSCEFIMNDCITTTKQSTTKPCAYFLGYTVYAWVGLSESSAGLSQTRQHAIKWNRVFQFIVH